MSPFNFTPFPEIKTSSLLLRQLKPEDENEIFIMRSDERILKYLDIPVANNIEDARKFIEKINNGINKNEWIYWGITLQNNPKLIGTICLWNISEENSTADAGYVLLNEYQGKGFMQEALKKVIDYGFNKMNFNYIEADVDPENFPSIKLLERFNFVCKRKSENTVIYTLIKK